MTATYDDHTGNGSNKNFTYTFPVLLSTDVKVSVDGVTQTSGYTVNTGNTRVEFTTAPVNLAKVRVYRETAVGKASGDEDPKAVFAAGSSVRATDLNSNFEQVLFATHELQDQLILAENIDTGAVTSAKILDDTIVNADVNTSAAIAGTKVSPNFGSQAVVTTGTLAAGATTVTGNITVSGTVDGRDVATDGSKLDGIEAGATGNQTSAEIRAAVEAATDSNVFTDADHSKLNAIEASATADQTAAEIRTLVESASDSNVFTDADHSKLNAIEASATADQTASEIKSLIASSPLDASHLAANSVTTSEIADAELTTLAGMQSGTASILASGTALTSTTAELNLLDGKSIVTSVSGSSTDVQLPTAKAVNDQIVNLLNDTGGFIPITAENKFPNTHPDPDNGVGTIVSIADAGGLVVNGAGIATNAATEGGTAVTINGIDSSLHSSTIAAGKGMLVQTTAQNDTAYNAGPVYTYHRLVVDEAGVATAQSLVTSFNERYRVGASNPTSSLDDGDLFFNTSSDKMLVYNATGSAWEEVQSVGNYFINTISSYSGTGGNSASFNGSAYRFVLSNPGANAEQHLVSINGVIQKPNSGTSQPGEGFAIDGSSIIFSAAPATGSDFFIITIGASVNIGTPSNNTVTNAILQSGCVDNAKVATNAAIAGSKLADDSIAEVKLDISNTASDGQFLQYKDSSDKLTWATVASAPEGTAVKSTGESGGSKYLREDGDGTCSWQSVPAGVGGATGVDFNDDVKARFGTGNDLEIYHSGSHAFIPNTTGKLFLRSDTGIVLQDAGGNESFAEFTDNGAVELYYDGTKKFSTYSAGTNIPDGQAYTAGDSNDVQLYHHSGHGYLTNNTGTYYIRSNVIAIQNNGGDHDYITIANEAGVSLYYDDSKKLETANTGVQITGYLGFESTGKVIHLADSREAVFGTGEDLKIYHDGTDSIIKDNRDSGTLRIQADSIGFNDKDVSETMLLATADGSVDLYYNGNLAFKTDLNGVQVYGTEGNDAYLYLFPDEADDLPDQWRLRAWQASQTLTIESRNGSGTYEKNIACIGDGAVELYYDSTKKFETTSTGTYMTGGMGVNRALGSSDEAFTIEQPTDDYHNAICMYVGQNPNHTYTNCIRINGHGDYSTSSGMLFHNYATSNAALDIRFTKDNGVVVGSVTHDSSSTSYNTSSDYRLKENNVAISDGITRLKTLKPYRFNFIGESNTVDGFFAHEVTPAVPEAITGTKDAMAPVSFYAEGDTIPDGKKIGDVKQYSETEIDGQSIDQSKLVPLLTAALQEAITKIETLETKVAALEAK